MAKLDLKKELKHLYSASSKKPALIDVPPMNFLMIDGEGDPNTSAQFQAAVEALFSTSYTLKFAVKKRDGIDYPVMALEGLWSVKGGGRFDPKAKDLLEWTLMIVQPEFITPALVEEALAEATRKKGWAGPPALRFERFHEGLSAQIMHLGPFDDEPPTVEALNAFIAGSGYRARVRHHEIYLSDLRRTDPAKLKTIIRHPVE